MGAVRNLGIKAYDLLTGSSLSSSLKLFEESQWWNRKSLENYQKKKFRRLINEAYRGVPFYHNYFKKEKLHPEDFKDLSDLKKLPIINKTLISKNPKEFINRNFQKSNLIQNRTGGTTGAPFRYFVTHHSNSVSYAQKIRGFNWGGLDFGTKYATLAGSSLIPDRAVPFKQRVKIRFENNYPLSAVHMDNVNMENHFNLLKNKSIDFLRGYPSAIYRFSKFLEETNKSLNLDSVFTTAEMLLPNQRKHIENFFDCNVFDNYGCKDGGGNAMECTEHNGLHASTERSFLEIVKGNVDSLEGEMLWTDFENLGMPFIRYSPGDLGEISDSFCSCGRKLPLLKSIKGRTTDMITFGNGITLSGPGMTLIFKDFNISQYQLIQSKLNVLEVKAVKNDNFNDKEIIELKKLLVFHCGSDVTIQLNFVNEIPVEDSSKFKFIKSLV